jgi:hypothetical protein
MEHRTFRAMGTRIELFVDPTRCAAAAAEADARGIPAVLVTTGRRAQLAGGLA